MLLATALAVLTSATSPPAACPAETAIRPGRWLVESRRGSEPPATGRAEIHRVGACVRIERLVLHFEDGSSHLVVFLQGWDPSEARWIQVQVGDHPLFLTWDQDPGPVEAYRTKRITSRGSIELRWTVEPRGRGFRRTLSVRRPGESDWSPSETMTYTPLDPVDEPSDPPPQRPGPFHDPDACEAEPFRRMDHTIGHWLNEEWVRQDERWSPATTSRVDVRTIVGGCALLEEHPIYEDGVARDRLVLVRGYVSGRDAWQQVVFGADGRVWRWDLEPVTNGWRLTPASGQAVGRLRILEHRNDSGFTKRIETRTTGGAWRETRRIRYVPW